MLQRTVTVSEIHFKSKERVAAGFPVEVFTRCTGGKDTLYEDSIRVMLQSETTNLHLIFPIAVSLQKSHCYDFLTQ